MKSDEEKTGQDKENIDQNCSVKKSNERMKR
jgi:hypothetical protein